MKILLLKVILLYSIICFGQDSIKPFNLTFEAFNHTERIFKGTISYILTDSSIEVAKTFFGERKSKIIYYKKFPKTEKSFSEISRLKLGSLKDAYFNFCIMATSGNEYFINYSDNLITKEITLHHYYLKEVDTIIQIINSNVPIKYRFRYLSKETKQDCKLQYSN